MFHRLLVLAGIGRKMLGEHTGLLAVDTVVFYRGLVKLFDQLAVKILFRGGWGRRCGAGNKGIHNDGFPAYWALSGVG